MEDFFDLKWFVGGSGYSGKVGNGLFFDDGFCLGDCGLGYYVFGDFEIEDCE